MARLQSRAKDTGKITQSQEKVVTTSARLTEYTLSSSIKIASSNCRL